MQWCLTLGKIFNRTDPVRILEIGSWEGRSTLFFLTYFTQGHLTAVDQWDFSENHVNVEHHYDTALDSRNSEARFDGNLAPYAARLTKRKGSSLHVLPQLLDECERFDVIYVDGSHFADDVLTDGINAWRLLKQGGVMIFDDLLWACYPRARANPAWAINLFLKYRRGEYDILSAFYQIILQKREHLPIVRLLTPSTRNLQGPPLQRISAGLRRVGCVFGLSTSTHIDEPGDGCPVVRKTVEHFVFSSVEH